MNKSATIDATTEESQKIETELLAIFAQIDLIDERISKDQEEIDRLKAKNKTALAQLRLR